MGYESGDIRIRDPRAFFIDGVWCKPSSDASFGLLQAHTEEEYLRVAEAQEEDGDRAVAAARKAFDQGPWPRLSHRERAAYLRRIAEGLRLRADEISHAWINQTGTVRAITQNGAANGAKQFDFYADLADNFPWVERHEPSFGGGAGYLVREAVGVVLAIIPWNAPLTTLAVKLAPALIAGCTVILKSSPEAPLDGLIFAEVCESVGLPAGVVNVLTADRAVSELLVRNSGVDKVTLTGSSAAGKRVAAICAERVARCTLELGGKSAAIVRSDYDVGKVAASIAGTAVRMSGQVCAALSRVIVPREKHDDLLEAMAVAFKAVRVGDPYDDATQLGPLAMGRQLDRVESYIEAGRRDGAMLAAGGSRPAGLNRGFFVEPTLFGNVDNGMTIAREEIFGPVVSVIPADSEEQAIAIANDSEFGLNSAVFTDDLDAAWNVARQLRAGSVGHNGFRIDMHIAFGGFKQSGIGREGGREGLLPFLESKTVLLAGEPSATP